MMIAARGASDETFENQSQWLGSRADSTDNLTGLVTDRFITVSRSFTASVSVTNRDQIRFRVAGDRPGQPIGSGRSLPANALSGGSFTAPSWQSRRVVHDPSRRTVTSGSPQESAAIAAWWLGSNLEDRRTDDTIGSDRRLADIRRIFQLRWLERRIRAFAATRGPTDQPIPKATVDGAIKLLRGLGSQRRLPTASPSADGEIGLFWFNGENSVESYFDEQGHFTWVAKTDREFVSSGDIDWDGSIPSKFLDDLDSLYA